jgi:hexokinase
MDFAYTEKSHLSLSLSLSLCFSYSLLEYDGTIIVWAKGFNATKLDRL